MGKDVGKKSLEPQILWSWWCQEASRVRCRVGGKVNAGDINLWRQCNNDDADDDDDDRDDDDNYDDDDQDNKDDEKHDEDDDDDDKND